MWIVSFIFTATLKSDNYLFVVYFKQKKLIFTKNYKYLAEVNNTNYTV